MADPTILTELDRLRLRHARLLGEHEAAFLKALADGDEFPGKPHELLRLEQRILAAERLA